MSIHLQRLFFAVAVYAVGILVRKYTGWGWPIGMVAVFIASSVHWYYVDGAFDWERRAAYSTLAYLPIQYAFFVGTTGSLTGNELFGALLASVFFKVAALYDRADDHK